jgi:hypothetical protein
VLRNPSNDNPRPIYSPALNRPSSIPLGWQASLSGGLCPSHPYSKKPICKVYTDLITKHLQPILVLTQVALYSLSVLPTRLLTPRDMNPRGDGGWGRRPGGGGSQSETTPSHHVAWLRAKRAQRAISWSRHRRSYREGRVEVQGVI